MKKKVEVKKEVISEAGKSKALAIAEICNQKKAENVMVLEVGKLTSYCQYFVICTSESSPQSLGLSKEIERAMELSGVKLHHREADFESSWVLMDFLDVVVHIFTPDSRQYYNLEQLWSAADKVPLLAKKRAVKKTKKS